MASLESPQHQALTASQTEVGPHVEEAKKRANRRAFPRHAVDCPVTVIPVGGVGQMAGSLSDISLGGCLVQLQQRYLAGTLVRVEVQFQLRGMAFRLPGVIVGTRGAQSFAIRFLEMPDRRRELLSEVLAEVAAINESSAESSAKEPASKPSKPFNPIEPVATPEVIAEPPLSLPLPGPLPIETSQPKRAERKSPKPPTPVSTQSAEQPKIRDRRSQDRRNQESRNQDSRSQDPQNQAPRNHDRRIHDRHSVDTRAKLLLIKAAITMTGRIANLSLGGCRIRTDERFSVGIFVRVETEFYLHGLPFRIAGVSQAIQDRNTIGIRFLDMSERCRAQLVELIAEIEESHALDRDDRHAPPKEAPEAIPG